MNNVNLLVLEALPDGMGYFRPNKDIEKQKLMPPITPTPSKRFPRPDLSHQQNDELRQNTAIPSQQMKIGHVNKHGLIDKVAKWMMPDRYSPDIRSNLMAKELLKTQHNAIAHKLAQIQSLRGG